jgi:hypothetical protein
MIESAFPYSDLVRVIANPNVENVSSSSFYQEVDKKNDTSLRKYQDNDVLNAKEAALYLKCSVKTLYNYKCKGLLKCASNFGQRRGGELRFRKQDLDTFMFGKKKGV